ncbi:hypothetical protein I5S53_08600 [Pseudomonas juntendi]|uniref:hypothetical protein n=1 Tax=Pseudomonas juntendi TaxID=2666183 RepID=UPI0018D8BDC9|nr:hypothetical protein [Pseudomonas juntendi]MBH3384030.1 hypothetical protein [Pseudomonas juntendi]MDG9918539.1 hypothetical protein [Pseudomonas juntendi]MDH0508125.1 hypothetical protein [Pseudomonas juntendi]MDH1043201.1 hypothetical protein [Pseudomonas juntendi]
MSEHEKVKQRAMRLKLKLDECAQLLADELISDDPHTQILRANALAERLILARSIVGDSDDKAELRKKLALLPSADELQAYAPLAEVSLRIGKIGKSREEEYLELETEFDKMISELNEIERNEQLALSTPLSVNQAAYSQASFGSGRPARGMLENLDRDLSEAVFTGRHALARAIINAERPAKTMGRPSRSIEEVVKENSERAADIESLIAKSEQNLSGVEILDRATKLYRDTASNLKRLLKESDGVTQSEAKSQLVSVEHLLKDLKKERARYLEAGEPNLPVSHLNSPRYHLLDAKSMLSATREIYNEISIEKDLKKLRR